MAAIATAGTTKSADGTVIAYSKVGHGPALVLADGAFCFRENGPSAGLAAALAEEFTVFYYDRRGRGESGDTKPYAVAREVEDLKAVMQLAGESACVFGMSSGAALALHGASAGLPIRKLVLYEPPYVAPTPGGPTLDDMRERLQALASANDRAGAVRYFLTEAMGAPRAFVFLMPLLMPGAWKKNMSVALTLPNDLTILSDRSLLDDRAKALRIPTLVVGGAKSPLPLRDAVDRVAKAIPNAKAVLLPDQTHNLSVEALAPVMRAFLLESLASVHIS
jgi:pimeloyl-ACP methyl ester carboxylesterase